MLPVAGFWLPACGARTGTGAAETSTGEAETSADTGDGCPQPGCRKRGWACPGPGDDSGCCDGLACTAAGPDGTDWVCGGVAAGGSEADCPADPPGATCEWVELSGCEGFGQIVDFCGAGRSVDKLRRCDGTCFSPDALYQTFSLCGCDTALNSDLCEDAECDCVGATWDAVSCCTD